MREDHVHQRLNATFEGLFQCSNHEKQRSSTELCLDITVLLSLNQVPRFRNIFLHFPLFCGKPNRGGRGKTHLFMQLNSVVSSASFLDGFSRCASTLYFYVFLRRPSKRSEPLQNSSRKLNRKILVYLAIAFKNPTNKISVSCFIH